MQGTCMKRFLSQHPYAVTSVIFLILLSFGFLHLNWRKDDYMFMLLLYFIVTLGIRLDDISRQIGSGREASPEADENVLSTLKQIRLTLKETNHQLKKISSALDKSSDA
jgi:hypothetical protein